MMVRDKVIGEFYNNIILFIGFKYYFIRKFVLKLIDFIFYFISYLVFIFGEFLNK